ncbi:enoyl-CoA hydratase/isomerase family protein [Sinosporangium siamense]|uniref:3-hydroxyisobutyryl-CoA hydrolase n=1 Tax=Sinosporangium siamense TaxID=1367973 RepID=A0A919RMR2_9ACTN|nr:enoyl-CoA hydratase/isomerase family protein [Sinosporangium siamense]GII94854.1 3-hydroxyisobutyryl-CoA hydrolase [Sinosporangium siamense]
MSTADVLLSKEDGLGRIILNRPKALNALTHGMVLEIAAALTAWEDDDDVRAVVITGAGERGLCAGGDIRAIYHDARAGGRGAVDFWRDEYRMNAHISRYRKPYVAIMDGIVMGGGVGVSAHGNVRIVTERSVVGMPEVGIGFIPDVGGTYLLSRAPGELGTHAALTSARLGPGDALALGLADHFVPAERLGDLIEALAVHGPQAAVAAHAATPPPSEVAAQRAWIDACYSAATVEEIVVRLRDAGDQSAKEAAEQITGKSPTSLKVTLRALREARDLSTLEEALERELRIATVLLGAHDLAEGIRAQVIDKDRNPQWSPATLEQVTPELVDSYFAPEETR